ncbi:16S rRNA (cytosine(1402)-N(4))-methyltransferase RsmH [Nostocoides sp. F2B08]|uniref:16S rRNA (cytosine(1402)-N(4))-methyltransferase RsmH n=1 Tax=Nostocoides sp. F2B08 TaxID=2653936 RepID=UPI001263BDE6|nr:16S rRNA (cytosine(1402)-N(4))-methyltransferase RsmH [Tetrasphaera sp. F2B08]KAB7741048.1 16S rRNA (cytosine(1402)-N(4))-methyltransferase RsmH [Tetrasphaera sp. F2B08]
MAATDSGAERHVPVLLQRCVDLLAPAATASGSVIVDATLGLGGHSEALLAACPEARVIGIDRDPAALALARTRLAHVGDRFVAVHAIYDELPTVLADLDVQHVQGILFDLGVSSLQIDEADRGFSYMTDAPLDMRMDPTTGPSAREVVNDYPSEEIERILRRFGEERYARRIAERIVHERRDAPILRTGQLVDIVRAAIPVRAQQGGHPAKRTFQALRIEVNAELRVWERAVEVAIEALAVGGRIVVLSYHSLEDRITKRALVTASRSSAPEGLPVELPEHAPTLRLLTRGAEEASAQEQAANPRSASVRLRAAERIRPSSTTRSPVTTGVTP